MSESAVDGQAVKAGLDSTPVELHYPLADHLARFQTPPFLFVGAGLSRRYAGLDGWETLLRRFAAQTGYDYEYFAATANGDYPLIGQLIADSFHDVWWKQDSYAESRERGKPHATNRHSALKIVVSEHIQRELENAKQAMRSNAELESLREAVIDGVITTNYDELLEDVFPDLPVYVGQDDLLFRDSPGIGEIYKIHGSVSDPNSLVLTRDDYQRFAERSTYLAAKLLTVFVENPVIFVGYSMSDRNVQAILQSIAQCLTSKNASKLEDRLIFVEWDRNASDLPRDQQLLRETIRLEGVAVPCCRVPANSFLPIFETLRNIERKYSTAVLRYLKNDVVRLVRSSDPSERVQVVDFDATADLDRVKVVIGVGSFEQLSSSVTSIGYKGLSREDLLRDILHNDGSFSGEQVIRETLPIVGRGNAYIPCFKYLAAANLLNEERGLNDEARAMPFASKALGMPSNLQPPTTYGPRVRRSGWTTISQIIDGVGDQFPTYLTELDPATIDATELRAVLIENESLLATGNALIKTGFAKCVCLLDYLENGPGSATAR